MKKKEIKLESLSVKAKKKKDFLIIGLILSIFIFIIISVGLTFLGVEKKKIFKKRVTQDISKTDISLIPKSQFKEAWAVSVDNTLNKILTSIKKIDTTTKKTIEKQRHDIEDMLYDKEANAKMINKEQQKIIEDKVAKLQKTLREAIAKQNAKIEEISSNKVGDVIINGGIKTSNGINTDDLIPNIIVSDKPKLKGVISESNTSNKEPVIEKKKRLVIDTDESNEDVNKIVGLKTIENNKTAIIKKDVSFTQKGRLSIINLDTSFNKKIIKQKEIARKKRLVQKEKINNTYHVMVGLTKAYMITGVYAPAFTAGDSEPLPVLLQAEGDVLIPNDDAESVDKCFFIGSAKGNMNSTTADIRLVSISCSLNGGKKMIEGAISGWVIGKNGVPGIEGELLHKNGAFLSRTFVSGFLETFANAFGGSKPTSIPLGGAVANGSSVGLGSSIKSNVGTAVSGGASTVFGKLGKYYLKMAEQIFPVIEVKGGQEVSILLKGGEDITIKDFHKANISQMEDDIEENNDIDVENIVNNGNVEYNNNNVLNNKKTNKGKKK